MSTDIKDRRLIGYIWDCGDPSCECAQSVIDEVWLQRASAVVPNPKAPGDVNLIDIWEERCERVWEGTWFAEPASWDLEMMRDELTGACERHKMERDTFERDRWEREL